MAHQVAGEQVFIVFAQVAQQAVDLAAEDYFNVNAVLSYLVRINLVARWTQLDEARGRAMLGRLLRELDGKELINNK